MTLDTTTRAEPAAAPARRLSAERQRARRRASRRRKLQALLFLLPLLGLNLVVVIGPSIATVWYSFTDWSGLGPATFIGLDNYTRAFADPLVREALVHNLIWFVLFLSVPMGLGLLGAYLLSQVRRFQMLFRALYFIPYVVASVVNASVWKSLLSPTNGIGHALGELGVPWIGDVALLGNTSTSLLSVNLVVDWHFWGFVAVIFLAAMQGVDPELYDAAKVDGASRWQQFTTVTLPGIRPTVVFLVLMTVIWSLKAFDYIYIMTQGGPAGSSEVVSTYMYKVAFNQYEAGYAASLGLTMAFVTAIILAVYQLLRRRGWEA
jgi:raffinose/stachyose/melibiose transport system permease protein